MAPSNSDLNNFEADESDSEGELRRILRTHIPEIAAGVVEIMRIAREFGCGAMVAVRSNDPSTHPVSVCVGPLRRGELRDLLGTERVSVVLWSASPQEFIRSALSSGRLGCYRTPKVAIDSVAHRALVEVDLSVIEHMVGKGGLSLRLASRLIGWQIRLVPFE
jgi:transcription termination/antitermination protein NusA